jgi:hypothetical protein
MFTLAIIFVERPRLLLNAYLHHFAAEEGDVPHFVENCSAGITV